MKFLTGDFAGRNIIPLNVYYNRGTFGKPDDVIDIVYKDLDVEKTYVETIINPLIEVWIVKPEFRTYKHVRNFIKKDQCYPIRVHYKTRFIEAGNELGIRAEEAQCSPYIMQIDMKIEHFYLLHFILEYETDAKRTLSIGYLDIENDIIRLNGFPNPGEAPINAITYINGATKDVYTLILGKDYLPPVPKEHPDFAYFDEMRKGFYRQVEEFKKDLASGKLFADLHEAFDESYGSDFRYHVEVVESNEIDLINKIWAIIRMCGNDYALVWNLPYDMQNLIERPKTLGYNPSEIMVDEQFNKVVREVSFTEDKNPLAQKRRHQANTYTMETWVDQMVEYVGIRAGRGKLPSAKLNAIAKSELGDEKLDYSEDADIKHLFYRNLRKFFMYNIKDVLLQFGIETKTNDMNTIYSRLYTNLVLFNEAFVTTAVVLNSVRCFAYKRGFVMGININKISSNDDDNDVDFDTYLTQLLAEESDDDEETEDDEDEIEEKKPNKDDEKFQGAFVLNPNHMTSTGFKIMGRFNKFIHNLMADLDVKSEYPTAIIIMNASNETMVAKLICDDPKSINIPKYDLFDFKDKELMDYKMDAGNFFLEVLTENDPLNMGEIFFNLPSPLDIVSSIERDFDESLF